MNKAASPAPTDLVALGRIVSAYGVRGWIKLQPYSDGADVLRQSECWWLSPSAEVATCDASLVREIKVLAVRRQGSDLVAQFEALSDRDQAESLKGLSVCVSRSVFPPAQADEYYWVDLIGCQVVGLDAAGQQTLLGTVEEVLDNGAHGVLKILAQRFDDAGTVIALLDAKQRNQHILVPFVGAHIQAVDIPNRHIESDWPLEF